MSARTYPSPYVESDDILGPINDANGRTASAKTYSSVRKVMGSDAEYNNMDRDPNNLNHHLQVMWDDVVGEPEGLHSMDSCWNCSRKTYDVSRTCCYGLLVILFGPLIALINGCNFACLSFGQIWCAGPCLRCCKINCGTFRKFTETCLLAVCAPYVEVCALIFSKIKVRHQKLPEADTDNAADYFNV
ncbi:caveolin-3 isoform X2 [Hyalella azteca]|uniref:Caveolin n=1 Tax=Hyalella azteca TaxID=294128 RepID=A0A8B7MZ98_HYAAZ|nr:caveolin-3 isoform X2 [Hyalella azteca]